MVNTNEAGGDIDDDTKQDEMLARLEMMSVLRPRSSQLENMRQRILCELEQHTKEEEFNQQYVSEVQKLKDERAIHLQAIEAIDKDIKNLESFIDTSNAETKRILLQASDLYKDFKPLKVQVDITRLAIGMAPLPEIVDIEKKLKLKSP